MKGRASEEVGPARRGKVKASEEVGPARGMLVKRLAQQGGYW